MNAICVICSDLLDESSPISAAPCGHVYHTNCLELWIDKSKTCPECRSRTYLRTIRNLYLNYQPKSDLNSLDLENKIENLTAQLSAKDDALEAFKKERDEFIAFMCDADEKICDMKDSICKLVQEVKELRLKAKSVSKLEAKILMLEKMNATLRNDHQTQKICATKDEDTFKDYRDHLKACLKLELPKAVKSKEKLKELNYKLENFTFATGIKPDDENAMKIPSGDFQEKITSLERLIPSTDFDEENLFALASTKSVLSKERVKVPVSIARDKKTLNMYVKAPGAACYSASSSQNKLEFIATVTARKNSDVSSVIRIKYH